MWAPPGCAWPGPHSRKGTFRRVLYQPIGALGLIACDSHGQIALADGSSPVCPVWLGTCRGPHAAFRGRC